jgi:hypothetical protein
MITYIIDADIIDANIIDNSINDTFMETYYIKGYGNTVVDVAIEQSKYHLIIEPNNTAFDKYFASLMINLYDKQDKEENELMNKSAPLDFFLG